MKYIWLEHYLKQKEIHYTWKFIDKKGVVKSRKRKSESMIDKGQQKPDLKRNGTRKYLAKISEKVKEIQRFKRNSNYP